MDKSIAVQGYVDVVTTMTQDYQVVFQLLLTLLKKHGDDPKLRFMIDGISHYYDNSVERLGNLESDFFVNEYTALVDKYYDLMIAKQNKSDITD